jgi:hypothetical protein
VQTRDVVWCDGVTVDGQDFRLANLSALLSGAGGATGNQLGVGGGVRDATSNPLKAAPATGLSVTVNAGFALVPGTSAANAGCYAVTLDTAATLTCQTADGVNARLDAVCVTVIDNGDATSKAVIQVITGTPAPGPALPALPANSVLLCAVTVPVNATSLSSGNLTDSRSFAVGAGGITPVLNSSFYPTVGGSAMYLHDISTGRLIRLSGSGAAVAPKTAAFAPATAGPATASGTTTAYTTVVSVTVTTDGNTPVEITATYKDINTAGTTTGIACTLILARDGSQIGDGQVKTCTGPDSTPDGGTLFFMETPAAGSHTYALRVANQGAGIFQVNSGRIFVKAISA